MRLLVIRGSAQLFAGVVTLLLLLNCNGNSPTAPLAQTPAGSMVVSGTVFDSSGTCIRGAVVEVLDGARAGDRLTQNECVGYWDDGPPGYSLSLPAGINVRMRASRQGYRSKEETFLPKIGGQGEANFVLEPE